MGNREPIIRETPESRCGVSFDKLAKISPAGIHSRPTDWDAYTPSRDRRRQQRPKPQGDRLLAIAAPGLDPATLDVAYHFDRDGSLLEVVVRERATGRQIAVLGPADIARIAATSTPGMLVERKG